MTIETVTPSTSSATSTTSGQTLPNETLSHTTNMTTITKANTDAPPQQQGPPRKPRRVIRRRPRRGNDHPSATASAGTPTVDPQLVNQILAASSLPAAYSFEILKSVQRIQTLGATHVALQMPEGLLLYATALADVLLRLAASTLTEVSVLGDVTYGACCVDDLGAKALGADLLLHYGHSCLVPLQHTVVPCLYVFVEIQVDVGHLVECLDATLMKKKKEEEEERMPLPNHSLQIDADEEQLQELPYIYLLGTVQFRHALAEASALLTSKGYKVTIPQAKPLSPGEVLGCTSPKLHHHHHETNDSDKKDIKTVILFVADGRFHLESTLISNPHISVAYRYDPYSKALSTEAYDHAAMTALRTQAIQTAAAPTARTFGIILGTLGRQGNPAIVQRIRRLLDRHGKRHFLVLLSEITPAKLQCFQPQMDVWVQVACPRLSVDWGHYFGPDTPILSSYELFVCLEETEWKSVYPMDYYSQTGGPWSNYYGDNKERKALL